jgi:TPR repeat protein
MLSARAPRGLGSVVLFVALLSPPACLTAQAPPRRYAVDAVIAQLEAGVSVARMLTLVMEGCVVDGPPTTAQAATLGRLGATGALLNALEKNPCARAPAPAGPAVTPTTVVPDSVRMRLTACDGGDALACVWAGYWYETGRGVPVDLPQAVRLYQRGCERGDATGCSNLGGMYEFGRGVPVDLPQAVRLYQRGCEGGNARGCTKWGYMYDTGRGVPVDLPQAVRLYQRGCEGGDARGCNNLGTMYESGRGVPVDRVRAQELYRKACSGGDTTACGKG